MEASTPRFQVLEGLPPYGPPAMPFPVSGQGSHHEGLVVRFFARGGDSWVGNFQSGLTSFSAVEVHPDGRRCIVISGGQGYIVDPDRPTDAEELNCWYDGTLIASDLLLLLSPIDLEAFAADGRRWKTARISWDGLRSVRFDHTKNVITGEAWSAPNDSWNPFEIDAQSGAVKGGSYDRPDQP